MTLSELVEYCVVKILEQQTSQEARRLLAHVDVEVVACGSGAGGRDEAVGGERRG